MNYPTNTPRPTFPRRDLTEVYCRAIAVLMPDLASRCATDPQGAIREAIRRLNADAKKILRRLDPTAVDLAEDVGAQVLMELAADTWWQRFDPTRSAARTYVFGVLRNVARKLLVKERPERRRDIDLLLVEGKSSAEPDAVAQIRADRLSAIAEAFSEFGQENQLSVAVVYPFLSPDLHGPVDLPRRTYVRRSRVMQRIARHPAVEALRTNPTAIPAYRSGDGGESVSVC